MIFQLSHVSYHYTLEGKKLWILKDISLSLEKGQRMALMGPSGSGKSTLLHIAGLLDKPQQGDVVIEGQACSGLSEQQRTALRRRTLGFVYQFHHLLPEFSAEENVVIPQLIAGVRLSEAQARARLLLKAVGLGHRLSHRPGELSGGEQQRTAMARALANRPHILLADEPTGNLDERTGREIFDLLNGLCENENMAILMATHNPELADQMDGILTLREGSLGTV